MEPENNGDGDALRRFITLLIGDGRHDLDLRAHAPADELRKVVLEPKALARTSHTPECPVESGDVPICTCGALYRLVVTSADDQAASVLALAKIV